jgi:hypothetical protein
MTFPNFFQQPTAYSQVRIGGILVRAVLVEVDGVKLEADWNEQRPTGQSGATWVFKGMKPVGPHKLTFEAVDAADFDDLRDLYERFAAKPTALGGPATKESPYTIGQTKDANSAGTAMPSTPGGSSTTDTSGFPKSQGTNPGPRPPTLSIENAFLQYLGVTAVSLKSWDGPKPTATRSVRVVIELVAQKPPTPAGTGVASTKGDQFTIGQTKDQATPAGSSSSADTKAAQAGAAT